MPLVAVAEQSETDQLVASWDIPRTRSSDMVDMSRGTRTYSCVVGFR